MVETEIASPCINRSQTQEFRLTLLLRRTLCLRREPKVASSWKSSSNSSDCSQGSVLSSSFSSSGSSLMLWYGGSCRDKVQCS